MASVRGAPPPPPPPPVDPRVDDLSPRAIRPEDEASAEGPALDEDGLPLNPAQLRSPSGELRVRPRQQRWVGDAASLLLLLRHSRGSPCAAESLGGLFTRAFSLAAEVNG